jgi:hypothetical protein
MTADAEGPSYDRRGDPTHGPNGQLPQETENEEQEEAAVEADVLSEEGLVSYLADQIRRAVEQIRTKPPDDLLRTLALGGAVELFNLAEQFGLMAQVRQTADVRAGEDTYGLISQAMQALLRPGRRREGEGGRGGRPPGRQGPRGGGPRSE